MTSRLEDGADGLHAMLEERAKRAVEEYSDAIDQRFAVWWVVTKPDDRLGRWAKGDVGFEVANDYAEKYDVMLKLPTGDYYFYADEVEKVLPDTPLHEAALATIQAWIDAYEANAE